MVLYSNHITRCGMTQLQICTECTYYSDISWALTHWGWYKMAAISPMSFSNTFSRMKTYELRIPMSWCQQAEWKYMAKFQKFKATVSFFNMHHFWIKWFWVSNVEDTWKAAVKPWFIGANWTFLGIFYWQTPDKSPLYHIWHCYAYRISHYRHGVFYTRPTFETPKYPRRPRDQYTA